MLKASSGSRLSALRVWCCTCSLPCGPCLPRPLRRRSWERPSSSRQHSSCSRHQTATRDGSPGQARSHIPSHTSHYRPLRKRYLFEQLLMGSFLMGSLRKVLANLRGRGKTLEITVPKSRKKVLSYKCANYPFRNYLLKVARPI